VNDNQGRHFCQCGCGEAIKLVATHFNTGIPRFAHGHNPQKIKRRVINEAGYVRVKSIGHPFADRSNRRVMEHRLVLEQHLRDTAPESDLLTEVGGGLYLRPDIEVHHVNGIKDDNRVENLVPMTRQEHARTHGVERGGLNHGDA
jgi:hypothetical protein